MKKPVRTWPAEKISRRVFLLLMAIAAAVFVLFYGIGFDELYLDNPDFNAPLFTDVLIAFTLLLLLLALVVAGASVAKRIRPSAKEGTTTNGVPEARINRGVAIFTLLCLVVTFLIGSSSAMTINGEPFHEVLWLKVADMFVFTSLSLLLVAVGTVVFEAVWFKKIRRK